VARRAHNLGGKGTSHTETAGSRNRPYSLGLKAQATGFKLRKKVRRHH